MSDKLVKKTFPERTMVKIEGIPFWLEKETTLLGTKGNFNLIKTLKKERKEARK